MIVVTNICERRLCVIYIWKYGMYNIIGWKFINFLQDEYIKQGLTIAK